MPKKPTNQTKPKSCLTEELKTCPMRYSLPENLTKAICLYLLLHALLVSKIKQN